MTVSTKYSDQGIWNEAIPSSPTTDSPFYALHTIEEHLHSASKVYPTGAGGVTVTSGGQWTLGNYAQVVPINTITSPFDIHFVNIEGANDDTTYELVLYAATTEIGRIRFTTVDIANARMFPSIPMQTPVIAANSQIQAKVMSSTVGADTVTISLYYHIY